MYKAILQMISLNVTTDNHVNLIESKQINKDCLYHYKNLPNFHRRSSSETRSTLLNKFS